MSNTVSSLTFQHTNSRSHSWAADECDEVANRLFNTALKVYEIEDFREKIPVLKILRDIDCDMHEDEFLNQEIDAQCLKLLDDADFQELHLTAAQIQKVKFFFLFF